MDKDIKDSLIAIKGYIQGESDKTRHILRLEAALKKFEEMDARMEQSVATDSKLGSEIAAKRDEVQKVNDELEDTKTKVSKHIMDTEAAGRDETIRVGQQVNKELGDMDVSLKTKQEEYYAKSKEMDAIIEEKERYIAELELKKADLQKFAGVVGAT